MIIILPTAVMYHVHLPCSIRRCYACISGNKLSRGETICPPPIAADLHPCADGSAVRTALVASPRLSAPSWPGPGGTDRRTDGSRQCLMPPPYGGGHNNTNRNNLLRVNRRRAICRQIATHAFACYTSQFRTLLFVII